MPQPISLVVGQQYRLHGKIVTLVAVTGPGTVSVKARNGVVFEALTYSLLT